MVVLLTIQEEVEHLGQPILVVAVVAVAVVTMDMLWALEVAVLV
jgi:hypothetical protein